ncbi:basic secretory protein-like protein [Niabella beijingensis]|uniref:basic secretory protein-like protein n=1 Tax=Niabella beijingensis TaxID=2872700 RepID=UPI001CBB3C11|nr:basic secretory protein-like protein [Niabella beijingensis]MBZ4192240.1 hypothetical protein [Niabella beijingensis]
MLILKCCKLAAVLLLPGLLYLGCKKTEMALPVDNETTDSTEVVTETDITLYGQLSVSTENVNGAGSAEGSLKMIDGDINTQFLTEHTSDFFVQMTFPEPRQVAAYSVTVGDIYNQRDPKDWTVKASNDGVNWVVLNRRSVEDFWARKATKRYDFINTGSYKYYRWAISETRWDHFLEVGEWRLFSVPPAAQVEGPPSRIDTTRQNGLTLIFVDETAQGLNAQHKQAFKNVFFTNYPKLMEAFNPNAIKTVYFKADPGYPGIAAAHPEHGYVYYGTDYIMNHTQDIDIVTHEIMHLVQNYPSGPGWVSEGIADYVRHVYGIDNAAANWSLKPPVAGESYTKGYGTAARFFLWMEHHMQQGLVKKLDTLMRSGNYTDQFWVTETGKTVDQLWNDYINNPEL